MALIWRGFGIAIPILIGIAALILSFFYDDTRIGNFQYTGWVLIAAGIPTILVALITFGGDEEDGGESSGSWTDHALFYVPVALWVPILIGGGIYCLVQ